MRLSHLFEMTQRGQQGTNDGKRDFTDVENELGGDFQVEDIDVIDPNTKETYTSSVAVELTHFHEQRADSGADNPWDHAGYTDVEWKIVEWVRCNDEDAEDCELVDGEVELANPKDEERIDQAAIEHAKDARDNDFDPDPW